jgi:predicted Rossmann fold flavoprotein
VSSSPVSSQEVIVVGAGAAGLATAIFARRLGCAQVRVVDGAARPGAKILVSGGSRCNVTNASVTERDFWGGRRSVIKRVLSRLPVSETIAFFHEIGVPLKEEPSEKLFPRSDRSRDVLEALLAAARAVEVTISPGVRVHRIEPRAGGFHLETSRGPLTAGAVVLATGGLSLPKTGSDGGGLQMARELGHSIVPTTPGLAPLVLRGSFNEGISGVSQEVELTLTVGGRVSQRIRGPMLWTHFGVSGPAALDMSRHWLRARLDGHGAAVTTSVCPGVRFEAVDRALTSMAADHPRLTLHGGVSASLPVSVGAALLKHIGVDQDLRLADLTRDVRRAVAHALTDLSLPIADSRGYNYAEVTAGGVALDEIDVPSMESRKCAGLFFAGEILDVDGRLGGFNFQWAWSSGRAAAEGLVRRARR